MEYLRISEERYPGLRVQRLSPRARMLMAEEVALDLDRGTFLCPDMFYEGGVHDRWPHLLKRALLSLDYTRILHELTEEFLLLDDEWYYGYLEYEVHLYPQVYWMKEWEGAGALLWRIEEAFAHYYSRGVCRHAMEEGRKVRLYEARGEKWPSVPHPLQGLTLEPHAILEFLREFAGMSHDPILRIVWPITHLLTLA